MPRGDFNDLALGKTKDYLVICEQTLNKLDDVKAYLGFVRDHLGLEK